MFAGDEVAVAAADRAEAPAGLRAQRVDRDARARSRRAASSDRSISPPLKPTTSGVVVLLGIDVLGAGRDESDRQRDVDVRRAPARGSARTAFRRSPRERRRAAGSRRPLGAIRPRSASPAVPGRASRSGHAAANHSAVIGTLTGSPSVSYLIDFKPHFVLHERRLQAAGRVRYYRGRPRRSQAWPRRASAQRRSTAARARDISGYLRSGAGGRAAAEQQQRPQILVVEVELPAQEPVEAAAPPPARARV